MTQKTPSNSGPNRLIVGPDGHGGWKVTRPGAAGPSATGSTQQAMIDQARRMLRSDGGGELTIQGRNGRFRDSDTVAPGRDPNPPRDTR